MGPKLAQKCSNWDFPPKRVILHQTMVVNERRLYSDKICSSIWLLIDSMSDQEDSDQNLLLHRLDITGKTQVNNISLIISHVVDLYQTFENSDCKAIDGF